MKRKILAILMAMAIFIVGPNAMASAGEIHTIRPDRTELQSQGGDVNIRIFVKSSPSMDLGVIASLNGEEVELPVKISGISQSYTASISFPENTTYEDQVYDVVVLYNKNDPDLPSMSTTITVKGKEKAPDPIINSFTTRENEVPLAGADLSLTIKGQYLDNTDFSLETFEKTDQGLVPLNLDYGTIDIQQGRFGGTLLSISPSDTNRTIIVKLLEKGQEVSQLEIDQIGKEVENLNYSSFIPKNTYLSDNELVVEYESPISEVTEGTLKDNITIDYMGDGSFEKLGPNDLARIEDNKIIINLVDKLPVFENGSIPRINFNKATFKTNDGFANDGNSNIFIKKSGTPIVSDAKIIDGYLLESQGGRVEIAINGDHLDDSKTKVKVLESSQISLDENGEDARILDPTSLNLVVDGSGKSQRIIFDAPANTSDKTKSYIVMVAVDGINYKSDLSSVGKEVKDKLVVSVLADDKKLNEPSLSYMTIQSYGSQGGGTDVPDNTYTEPPLSQGSKKTLVHVYGTNLDPSITKIRFKDQNGVYWYPSNDASKGAHAFTMVMMDNNTGMTGGGNSLLMEVIMPNGYSEDMLFTYEVAVDGINYDQDTTVSAFLRAPEENKAANAPGITEIQKEVLVRFEDELSKSIASDKAYRIMTNIPIDQTEIGKTQPIAIDGYEYQGIKGDLDNPYSLKTRIGDRDELIFVYKNLNPQEEEQAKAPDNKQEESDPPKDEGDLKLDKELKSIIISDLDELDKLSSAEKKDYKDKIDKAPSNVDIYKIYKQATDLDKSRINKTILEVPRIEKEYVYIPSGPSKVLVEKSPDLVYIKDKYIYVQAGYECIKEGYYKKDELYKKYYRLRKSMYDNDIMVKSAEFLLENTPKTVASVRDKLLYQIQKSNKLQDRANKSASEYEQILGL